MKKLLTILICSICFTAISHAGVVKKGVTWLSAAGGNDHTYYLVEYQNQSWDDATADIFSTIGPGFHLATITSQDEQDMLLNNLFSSSFGIDYSGEYWLGGYQFPVNTPGKSDNWTWITNEAWDYTNWQANEPNDQGGPSLEQHLAIKYSASSSGWNDEGYYHNIRGYIAESVPEPSTLLLMSLGLMGLTFMRRAYT